MFKNRSKHIPFLSLLFCALLSPQGKTQAQTTPAVLPPSGIDESVIDASVSPCDDFYRFACGNWIQKTEIPADRPSWSRGFSEINERNQTVLREVLDENAAKPASDANGKKLGDLYKACMDENAIEKNAATELAALLKPIEQVKTRTDVAKEIARQHLGIGKPLFDFSQVPDFKNATQIIGNLDQGGLGLPDREYYLKTDEKSEALRKEYLAHVERVLVLSGIAKDKAAAQAGVIVSIEKRLAQASMSRVDRREPKNMYHRIDLDGVLKLAPNFDWKTYFAALGIPSVKELNVTSLEFFKALNQLVAEEKIENIRAYLRWNNVHNAASALSKPFVEETFAFFSKKLTGTDKILPRWKRCVGFVDHAMGEALGTAFVKKTFGDDGKKKALEIIHGIEAAMEQNIKTLTWMDDATRRAALGKLQKITNKIGFPDKPRNYDALVTVPGSHLKNIEAAAIFESRRELAKIGKPRDKSEWLMTPPTVNAYYEPQFNEMAFPAGILQPPMFGRTVASATNYGAIGMVMGHEVTHGFDDEGRQFDEDGNLRDWWSQTVNTEFNRRAQCVVEQYNGYKPLPDAHIDGKLTLGENIADLGGLKLALLAFRAAQKKAPAASKGKYSDEQLFFLGMAQSWCEKRRPELARLLINVDPHSPAEFRVNGPLSNLSEFAAAWKCPSTAKMVRKNQCQVW
ncbi:MAG TPA: M13 family metallopeptidase [Pseudomonadota bacterium]|nr:M13 family metallopeptidase [Pseudomonadota bacterium]